ncbi:MAG: adenosylcobinamide-GDP ribazoletransferase [Deltaproteobacteria bacterium]|nr:adenosylcobinamide-GDP ribazoletransferase [Deltaproteobacteria bacterium]
MNSLILAIQFLTVFTIRKDIAVTPRLLAAALSWFPLVAALQGAIMAASDYLLSGLLPVSVRSAVAQLILALTNGGLHLDGFADTVDGLAGGKTPQERLRIMKDSRIGAVGVVFLVLLLLVKFLCINELPTGARLAAIFLFPVAGRWSMVPLSAWSRYARSDGGLGMSFVGAGRAALAVSTVMTAAAIFYLLGPAALSIMAVLAVVTFFSSRFFKERLGGITGDVFGFQSEAGETFFLISFLALGKVIQP